MREIKQVIVAVYFFCNYIYANENHAGVPCGQEELQRCAAQLKAVEATREFNFVYNKEQLDKICPDLHIGLECIKSYSRRCMSLHEREHINKIYDGTNEMIRELCMEGQYQQDFLRYSPCMNKVRNEYDHCKTDYQRSMEILYGPQKNVDTTTTSSTTTTQSPRFMQITLMKRQQMNSDYVSLQTTTALPLKNISSDDSSSHQDKLQIVCCAFQRYMDCSAFAIEKACGNETAEFTRNFLGKMLSALMRMHCQEIQLQCQNSYTASSGSISSVLHLIVIVLATVAIYH